MAGFDTSAVKLALLTLNSLIKKINPRDKRSRWNWFKITSNGNSWY